MSAHRGAGARAEYLGGCHGASRTTGPYPSRPRPEVPHPRLPDAGRFWGSLQLRGDAQTQAWPAHSLAPQLQSRSRPCPRPARAQLRLTGAAPGKVWWCGGSSGQAAQCSAAASTGTPKERTREAGPGGRSRVGGGQPGREAETRAPSAGSAQASSSALLGPPHAGRGRHGSPRAWTLSPTARRRVGAAPAEHPSLGLCGVGRLLGFGERRMKG